MIDLIFFKYLKGCCHGNQFCFVPDLFARNRSISGSAGPIFTIFAPYGRYWFADDQNDLLFPIFKGRCHVHMIDLYLVFQYFEGRCHGNQLILGKCHKRRLIQFAFFALSFENKWHYHCLNEHVNSGYDVAISCKNLVNFCRVTPEIMELIWERQVLHGQKQAYFVEYLRIYWTDFRNVFTTWKHFTCRWCICTLFSNLSSDVAMATK